MSFARRLEPELLDQLSPDDPRAVRSRRDLVRINVLMGHCGIMTRTLLRHCGTERPRTIVDLGGGDGSFALALARRLAVHWPAVRVILVDRQAIVRDELRAAFSALGWEIETVTADLLEFLEQRERPAADVAIANLFLHHFESEELARALAALARWPRLFVACEPRRSVVVREMSRLLWLLGCNDVSVHDAVASTRAGFRDHELTALWPERGPWRLHEHAAGAFSHCFVAQRAPDSARESALRVHAGSS